jgi:hypothetical protein
VIFPPSFLHTRFTRTRKNPWANTAFSSSLTDRAVIRVARSCTRLRYIDLACASQKCSPCLLSWD